MDGQFKIRSYGYGELAQLYFPNISKKSASVQLRKWIIINQLLKDNLTQSGYKPRQRIFTPKQVTLIIEHLGEPN